MDPKHDDALDLRHLLGVLWKRAWLIALLVAVAGVAAYGFSSRQTKLYAAVSSILVTNPASESVFDSGGNAYVDPERQVATQSALILSPRVTDEVDARLGDRATLVREVDVAGATNKDLIDVTVTSTVPEVARDAADLYAEVYLEQRKATVTQTFDQRAADLREQSAKLDEELRAVQAELVTAAPEEMPALQAESASITRQIEDFNSRASQLEAEAAIRTGNVEIASPAQVPNGPFAPTPKKDAALAAVLALLAGVGFVLLFDRFDDRLRTPEQAERAADLPLLGSVPIYAPNKKRSPHHLPHSDRTLVPLSSVHAEAYRTLRTSLRFSNLGKGAQVVMITSSSGSEGKSTVTANLAVALAESGLKVVVVSADLRRPVVSGIFGVADSEQGLSTTLIGETRATDCLQGVTLADDTKLWVLPAGSLPHNPAELLGSPAMEELLGQLRRAGVDFVLVDCPPVLPVADALAIAQYVDGVLLLAVPGQTRSHSLEESAERLRRVGARLIGLVLNGVPLSGGRYSYYYYRRYGYQPYGEDSNQRKHRSPLSKDGGDGAEDSSLMASPKARQ